MSTVDGKKSLRGHTRKIASFESLAKYPEMRECLQNLLEQGEKITPKQWKAEIQSLQSDYDSKVKDRHRISLC